MSKIKKKSLKEERGRTPHSYQDYYSYSEDISCSRQEDVSVNKNRRKLTPYSRQDVVSSSRNSRNRTPYFRQDDDLSNGNRNRNPYSHQGDASYSEKAPYSEEISYSRSRQDTSLNRNKSRTPYSLREGSLLSRSRRQTPYSHLGDYPLNIRENVRERMERDMSEENHGRNESRERDRKEIAELRFAISDLAREVRELRQEKEKIQSRTQHSLSSDPSLTRYTKFRKTLEPMNQEYKKAFRDEVVHILKSLDDSLMIDHKNRWTDIERHVTQDIIPAIKRMLGDRFQYTEIELKKVLQNLHRHRRDSYKVSKNPLKSKANKQRTGINTRRKEKKERRQKGFRHMIEIGDQGLIDLQPSIPWDDWIEGFEAIINDSNYHSDEVSESDEEKVQEEKNRNIRLSRNKNSNHVLHVYDKQWRSSRIRDLLRHADLMGESIQNNKVGRKRWYNDQLYIEDSNPPHNAPAWAISSSYHSE